MVSPVMDGDTDQLGRAVRELADRAEINDLVSHLGRWLDEKRFDDTRSVFTEDAIGEFPSGPIRGVEALTDQARRHHADFERTQHITTNTLVAEEQTPWGGSPALMTEYGALDEGLHQPSPDSSTPQSLGLGPSVG